MISKEKFEDFFAYYKEEPQQLDGVLLLYQAISQHAPSLLDESADWIVKYRSERVDSENSWQGIYNSARAAGSRYPELVSAQWALESGWGKHTSGKNNFFGLKGTGTTTTTEEYINGQWVTITAGFIDFPSIDSCVAYLVDRWYKDYKFYIGVNNAKDRNAAARMLVSEGYATDPDYASKLIKLMDEYAPLTPVTTKLTPYSPFSFKVTPNFTYGELTLNEEARRFTNQGQCDIAAELCQFLEKARGVFGPIAITSCHRPPAVNAAVGGASNSEHLFNKGCGAVDCYPINGRGKEFENWVDKNWPYSVGYGMTYRGFVHIGIREGRPRVRWDY